MKISKKADYGIRALIYLASYYNRRVVQMAEIAAHQDIPEAFLHQLLTTLRKAGFINSLRGTQGGHMLARPPEEITVGRVLVALEGSLAPIECADADRTQETANCARLATCAQREVWLKISQDTQRVLDATTIADLAAEEQRRLDRAMYYI